MPSPLAPLSVVVSSDRPVGAGGAVDITVTEYAADATPVLPAASVALAVMLCVPFDSVEVVMPNAPVVASDAPVPMTVVPFVSYSMTVLPGSAVPSIFTCAKLVIPSPSVPLSVVLSRESPVGAAGAAVSTVTEYAVDATPVFPAASVAFAVMLWVPFASADVVIMNAPVVALAMPEPSTVVPLVSYSVTVLPASAVPSIFTCVKLVIPSPSVPLSVALSSVRPVGIAGAVVSMTSVPAGL